MLSYGCFLRTSGAKYWLEESHKYNNIRLTFTFPSWLKVQQLNVYHLSAIFAHKSQFSSWKMWLTHTHKHIQQYSRYMEYTQTCKIFNETTIYSKKSVNDYSLLTLKARPLWNNLVQKCQLSGIQLKVAIPQVFHKMSWWCRSGKCLPCTIQNPSKWYAPLKRGHRDVFRQHVPHKQLIILGDWGFYCCPGMLAAPWLS